MNRPLVAIDTETTSLNPALRRPWDIGYIIRHPDGNEETHQFFVDIDDLNLTQSDPMALQIGRFHERHPQAQPHWIPTANSNVLTMRAALTKVGHDLHNATVIGAVPWFDTHTIEAGIYRYDLIPPTWHYHLVDVETLAAGRLGLKPPWDFNMLLAQFGLTYTESDRHTALGDARMALRFYDAVYEHAQAQGTTVPVVTNP